MTEEKESLPLGHVPERHQEEGWVGGAIFNAISLL